MIYKLKKWWRRLNPKLEIRVGQEYLVVHNYEPVMIRVTRIVDMGSSVKVFFTTANAIQGSWTAKMFRARYNEARASGYRPPVDLGVVKV